MTNHNRLKSFSNLSKNKFVEDEGWHNATYACINLKEAAAPMEIEGQSICVGVDVGKVLGELRN